MRRIALPLLLLGVACGNGNSAAAVSAADAELTAALGQAGIQCIPHDPPPFAACAGKNANDPCQVVDDEGTESGTCKQLRDGRLVCADADDDDDGDHHGDERPPPPPLTDACAKLSEGAACSVQFREAQPPHEAERAAGEVVTSWLA